MEIEESLWCLVVTLNRADVLLVGLIYRSPNSTVENNGKILQAICNLYSLQKFSYLLLLGDFNLPNINWNDYSCPSDLSLSAKFLDAVQDTFLTQHVNAPTRHHLSQTSLVMCDTADTLYLYLNAV